LISKQPVEHIIILTRPDALNMILLLVNVNQGFNDSPYMSYPEYYLIEIISMPTIEKISWVSDIEVPSIIGLQAGWLVEGKGFSTSVDTFVGNYNDLYDFLGNHSCTVKRTHNSFY